MTTCPVCDQQFEPKVIHQVYDRMSCRKRAERQRARLRDKGATIDQASGHAEHAHVGVEATPEILTQFAEVYLRNSAALPTFFHNMPTSTTWQPPFGVTFKRTIDGNAWVMEAGIDMEAI